MFEQILEKVECWAIWIFERKAFQREVSVHAWHVQRTASRPETWGFYLNKIEAPGEFWTEGWHDMSYTLKGPFWLLCEAQTVAGGRGGNKETSRRRLKCPRLERRFRQKRGKWGWYKSLGFWLCVEAKDNRISWWIGCRCERRSQEWFLGF